MKCQELNEYFDDYILGEADPALEIRINEHLLECHQCRQVLEVRERLLADFRRASVGPPPESAWRAVRRAIGAGRHERKPFYARWFFQAVYVAAAFLAGMVLMRTADVISLRAREKPVEETRIRPPYRVPYSDTVQFYAAPAKNLAKI